MPDHSKILVAAKREVPRLRQKKRTRWAADVMERLVAIIEGEPVSPDNPATPSPDEAVHEARTDEPVTGRKLRRKQKEAAPDA